MEKSKRNRLNQRIYLKKWLLMLVQGILLILTGIAFFSQPETKFAGFQVLVGLVALLNGVIFILVYFFADPFDNSKTELILGIILSVVSLIFLFATLMDQNRVTLFVLGYMLANSFLYAITCWFLQSEMKFWWITLLLPAYTILIVLFTVDNPAKATFFFQLLAGLQFLWCGITVMIMSFISRRLENEFKKPISHFRTN